MSAFCVLLSPPHSSNTTAFHQWRSTRDIRGRHRREAPRHLLQVLVITKVSFFETIRAAVDGDTSLMVPELAPPLHFVARRDVVTDLKHNIFSSINEVVSSGLISTVPLALGGANPHLKI